MATSTIFFCTKKKKKKKKKLKKCGFFKIYFSIRVLHNYLTYICSGSFIYEVFISDHNLFLFFFFFFFFSTATNEKRKLLLRKKKKPTNHEVAIFHYCVTKWTSVNDSIISSLKNILEFYFFLFNFQSYIKNEERIHHYSWFNVSETAHFESSFVPL